MLGTVATYYETDAVLMAVGTTAAVVIALTIFAFQTKIDFTGCGGGSIILYINSIYHIILLILYNIIII